MKKITLTQVLILLILFLIGGRALGLYYIYEVVPKGRVFGAQVAKVEAKLSNYQFQTKFLSVHPEIRNFARKSLVDVDDVEERDSVEKTLVELAFHDPLVFQVRVVELDGQELLQVSQSQEGIHVSPQENLQNIGSRGYFQGGAQLVSGEVFTSEMSLFSDDGTVSKPLTPTIRFASPIIDPSNNETSGVFVLNIFAHELIKPLTQEFGEKIIIFDQNGNYLYNLDHKKEFGSQLGTGITYFTEHPNESPQYYENLDDSLHFEVSLFSYTFVKKIFYEPKDTSKYWIIVLKK